MGYYICLRSLIAILSFGIVVILSLHIYGNAGFDFLGIEIRFLCLFSGLSSCSKNADFEFKNNVCELVLNRMSLTF